MRGLLAQRRGGPATACAVFARLEQLARQWGASNPCVFPWAPDAIAAYLDRDLESDARRVIAWVDDNDVAPSRWPGVVVATGRAAIAERAGDADRAEAGFTEAMTLLGEMETAMPLVRARTLTDYGAFITRHGEPGRARPLLAEALRVTEACGAGWHADRARAQWRRAGGRSGTTPPGELTPQETAVARLVQTGRTNKEIAAKLHLSVSTVQTHLAHVYRKLGIRRRWELMARSRL